LTSFVVGLATLSLVSFAARAESPLDGPDASSGNADAPRLKPGFTTLYRFQGGKDGYWPRGGVIVHDGAIYGTTLYDGLCSTCGIVYKLTDEKGSWKLSVPHYFNENAEDGIAPTAPLTISGNTIFATTSAGANFACGCGEVFQLALPTGYKIIKHLAARIGEEPIGGLLIGRDGTMYGTTSAGGAHDGGVVYKVEGGSYSVLYNLPGNPNNPASGPFGELIFGKDDAIYGTSYGNGKYDQGYVFRLTTGGSFKDLYDFQNNFQTPPKPDGAQPEGRLALGKDGTIYGTTTFGGSPSGYGTAWSIKAAAGGKWDYKQLYIFGSPGNLPHSGLVIAGNGVLYGTGAGGGAYQSGAIYSLTETTPGKWKYTLLHSFEDRAPGGDTPYADLFLQDGVLYGTTLTGGHVTNNGDCINGCGTVFQFVP